jgi:hypothetical protein
VKPKSKVERRPGAKRKRRAEVDGRIKEEPLIPTTVRSAVAFADRPPPPEANGDAGGPFLDGEPHLVPPRARRPFQGLPDGGEPPWLALYAIEKGVADALASADNAGLRRLAAELEAWFDEAVADSGLLRLAPADTPRAVPVLVRLRSALRRRGWKSGLDARLKHMLDAVGALAAPGGWLLGPSEGLSPQWKQMLRSLKSQRPFQASADWIRRAQRGKRFAADARRELGIHCEAAGLASMRDGRRRGGTQAALDFSQPACRLDLRILGWPLLRGVWGTRVSLDGREIPLDAAWSSVCWNEDEDGQFLEISMETPSGAAVDRQIFVSTRRSILFLVDIVRVEREGRIDLEWTLPTANVDDVSALPSTRAQKIAGPPFDVRLLPLFLPADPRAPSRGGAAMSRQGLRVWASANGRAIVAPIAVEWDRRRLPAPRVWRPLTVTQDRRVVAPDEAAAWRVPHAGRQLAYFRSTLGVCRLAFLGCQTFNECVIGEMGPKGVLSEWLAVDTEPDKPIPH